MKNFFYMEFLVFSQVIGEISTTLIQEGEINFKKRKKDKDVFRRFHYFLFENILIITRYLEDTSKRPKEISFKEKKDPAKKDKEKEKEKVILYIPVVIAMGLNRRQFKYI